MQRRMFFTLYLPSLPFPLPSAFVFAASGIMKWYFAVLKSVYHCHFSFYDLHIYFFSF